MPKRKGRPRHSTAKRHPNGSTVRLSEAQQEQDAVSVALEARQRVFGVSEAQALAMPETSFLGRLRASDELSQRQYDAAMAYRELMEAYYHLFPVRPLPEAGNLDRGYGYDGSDGTDPAYIERARRLTSQASLCREALNDANRVDARVRSIVENVVLHRREQPWGIEPLRLGLNVLANVFNLPIPKPQLDRQGVIYGETGSLKKKQQPGAS